MATLSYVVPGLVLAQGHDFSRQVQDLQRDLRSLGYGSGPIDGVFGPMTAGIVEALEYDLMHNDGSSTAGDGNAPVAIKKYNNGSVTALSGVVDQGLAACIEAMLADAAYPKLPFSANPAADNQAALKAVMTMQSCPVPIPFLMAILAQESGCRHFQLPAGASIDNFVTLGMDRNNKGAPAAVTSRGYGIGQYTLFHHPPTAAEVANVIGDPVKNVSRAVKDLADKFQNYVNGATADMQAGDRLAEFGTGPLRTCQHPPADARYLADCATCAVNAGLTNIVANVTELYANTAATYQQTQYHGGSYQKVPVRHAIPCDWAYAVRRYNGSGVNSYDYQAEVLQRIAAKA